MNYINRQISFTNKSADTYYFPIGSASFDTFSIHTKSTTGASDTIQYSVLGTNDKDADTETVDETEWANISDTILGSANIHIPVSKTSENYMHFVPQGTLVHKMLLKVIVTGGVSNSFYANLKMLK